MYSFIELNYVTNQFIDLRFIHTNGTKKMRSHSESQGVHKGGRQNKQNSLGGTEGCSVK
jgi:hypothetical protein